MMRQRNRMVFELPEEMQVAIRLKAAKTGRTNADVICMAMEQAFRQEVEEARAVVAANNPDAKPSKSRQKVRA